MFGTVGCRTYYKKEMPMAGMHLCLFCDQMIDQPDTICLLCRLIVAELVLDDKRPSREEAKEACRRSIAGVACVDGLVFQRVVEWQKKEL